MFRTFQIPLPWPELFKRTLRDASEDNVLGLAAQLAYYFLLALAPAIVCLAALASFFPPNLIHSTIASLQGIAPGEVTEILRSQLGELGGGADGGVFTLGLLFALWSSSAAMVGICDALNRAYDIEEGRPWWKVRLTAIGLTIALSMFVIVSFALVIVGPTVADQLAVRMGLGEAFAWTWKILQWPIVFVLIATAVGFVYYFAPDAEQDWEWITPGAVLATVLWLIASLGFKIYVGSFADYNATYGSLAGVIILMLWFYISALAILAGAEMNAEIEHASAHGKDPGEKVPGEKKKIGTRGARAYEERKRREQIEGPREPMRWPAAAFGKHKLEPRPSIAAYGIVAAGLLTGLKKKHSS
jgi:membrane protein